MRKLSVENSNDMSFVGVDINRNFDAGFGIGYGTRDIKSETYAGEIA